MASQPHSEFESNSARIPNDLLIRSKVSKRLTPTAIRGFAGVMLVAPDKDGVRSVSRRKFLHLSGLGRTQADLAIAELIEAGVIKPAPAKKDVPTHGYVRVVANVDLEGNYTILPDHVVASEDLDSAGIVVVATVLSHRNQDSAFCFPAVEKLATETGMSERVVTRHLTKARDAGLLKRVQRGFNESSQTWFEWLNPERFALSETVASPEDLAGWTPVAELVPPETEEDRVAELATVHQLPVALATVPDDTEVAGIAEEFLPVRGDETAVPNADEALRVAGEIRQAVGAGYTRTSKERRGARRVTTANNSLMRPLAIWEIRMMLIYASGHDYFGARANTLEGLPDHVNEIFFSADFRRWVESKRSDLVEMLPPATDIPPALAPIRGQLLADNTTDYSSWEGELK